MRWKPSCLSGFIFVSSQWGVRLFWAQLGGDLTQVTTPSEFQLPQPPSEGVKIGDPQFKVHRGINTDADFAPWATPVVPSWVNAQHTCPVTSRAPWMGASGAVPASTKPHTLTWIKMFTCYMGVRPHGNPPFKDSDHSSNVDSISLMWLLIIRHLKTLSLFGNKMWGGFSLERLTPEYFCVGAYGGL